MISSFWNLCRACPSVPVEKLHSEYRSTFQWHEYVGSRDHSSTVAHQAVLKQPSQTAKPHVFWSGGSGEEERRGKRISSNNVNVNPSLNGWWLRSTTDQLRSQNQAQNKGHSKLEAQPSAEAGAEGPRKSLSLGTIRALETSVPVHTHKSINLSSNEGNVESGAGVTGLTGTGLESQSQVPDNMDAGKGPDSLGWMDHKGYPGNMSSSQEGAATDNRREYKSEYKKQFRPFSQYEYVDGKFFKKRGDQEVQSGPNPWYKEVIELRKKAGEYRYRGWGTELVPQHLADVYHQNVWDQVSRRSSLAALALITTTTQKSISKEEKDKENARKSMPKRSLSRPNTATPKHPLSDLKTKDPETVQGAKKKYDGAAAVAARGKARSQSAGPGGRSPRKATRQSILSKEREISDPNKRHPRPTTLATSPRPKASSDKGHRDLNSKLVKTLQFDQSSADPSMGFSEPVIKSPPEPTRLDRKCVKSPDQVILRSPDPVNWTVPLDTTKSFTVTQNIRDAPPSPRFRAGVDSRSGHHHFSGQHSSAGSTKASSPLSSFSSRSAGLAQTHKLVGQSQSQSQSVAKSTPGQKPISQTKPEKALQQQRTGDKKSVLQGGGVGETIAKSNALDKKPLSSDLSSYSVNGYDHGSKKSAVKDVSEKEKATNGKLGDRPSQTKPVSSTSGHYQSKPSSVPAPAPRGAPPPPPTSKSDSASASSSEANVRRPVPGTTLQCLEDPKFMFDPPKTMTESMMKPSTAPSVGATHQSSGLPRKTPSTTSPPVLSPPQSKPGPGSAPIPQPRGAIRVLEAPTAPPTSSEKLSFIPPAPVAVASSKRPGVGTTQVSETLPHSQPQPKLPTYHVLDAPDPTELYGAGASVPTTTATTTSKDGSRTHAANVIDKARNRFDKFWGKDKDKSKDKDKDKEDKN